MSKQSVVQAEQANDPVSIGYTGNDVSDAALMNSLTTGRTTIAASVTSSDIYEAMVRSEYDALSASDKVSIDQILGLGDGIPTDSGSKTRADILAIFGGGSTTWSNLVAVVTSTISRATELGVGRVHSRDFK